MSFRQNRFLSGAKTNFLSRNYQHFDVWKMWILWKMRFWKCEFWEKWDFQNVNFRINWGFLPQCVTKKTYQVMLHDAWSGYDSPRWIVEYKIKMVAIISTSKTRLKLCKSSAWFQTGFYSGQSVRQAII